MTEERLPLAELMTKAGDGDFLCGVAEAVVQLLMDTDVDKLIGAVLLEANDEWQTRHLYMQTEPMAELVTPMVRAVLTQITTVAT